MNSVAAELSFWPFLPGADQISWYLLAINRKNLLSHDFRRPRTGALPLAISGWRAGFDESFPSLALCVGMRSWIGDQKSHRSFLVHTVSGIKDPMPIVRVVSFVPRLTLEEAGFLRYSWPNIISHSRFGSLPAAPNPSQNWV